MVGMNIKLVDEYQNREAFEIKNTASLSEDYLKGHIVQLKKKTEKPFAIANSGSPMSFLDGKTARRLQENDKSALFKRIPPENAARNLSCYNGKTIIPKRRLIITVESGGWKIQAAPFIIVDDKKANIIRKNILPQIGIKLVQEKQKRGDVLHIREPEESNPNVKQWVKTIFHNYVYVIESQKTTLCERNLARTLFRSNKREARIPVHLQERVKKELNKLIDQKHIIKLDKCSDRQFNSPIVITVKKDQMVKLALVSKEINQFIHNNKYQMPNIDLLLDNIAANFILNLRFPICVLTNPNGQINSRTR